MTHFITRLRQLRHSDHAVAADKPLFTTVAQLSAAVASVDAIRAGFDVTPLQEYERRRSEAAGRKAVR